MTRMISVNSISVSDEAILVTGSDLDAIILQGDVDGLIDELSFSFSRANRGEMTYLVKVTNKCKGNSLQERLDNMVKRNTIITINDNFRVKEA